MNRFFALLTIMFASLFGASASAQQVSFALIDKYALTVQDTSVALLSNKLTAKYKTDKEKVRSIFRWITHNIAYDIEGRDAPKIYGNFHHQDTVKYIYANTAEYNRVYQQNYLLQYNRTGR